MIIIWRGYGLVVPIVCLGAPAAFYFLAEQAFGAGYPRTHGWVVFLGLVATTALMFFIARSAEKSGREGDHFFFIPLRIWPMIFGAYAVVMTISLMINSPARSAQTEPVAAASTAPAPEVPAPQPAPAPVTEASAAPTGFIEPPTRREPPKRPPVTQTVAEEAPRAFAQVYIDNATRTYYTENCPGRPAGALKIAKSAAVTQGYSPACP